MYRTERVTSGPPPYSASGSDESSLPVYGPPSHGPYATSYAGGGGSEGVDRRRVSECDQRTLKVAVSCLLVLVTLAIAYFCLEYGFTKYDHALGSFDRFKAGAMMYMGVVFSCVAIANVVLALCHAARTVPPELDSNGAQIGLSLFAPILFIPAACCFGLQVAVKR